MKGEVIINKKNKIIISSVACLTVIAIVGTLKVNNINAKNNEEIKVSDSVNIEDNTEETSEIIVPPITPLSMQISIGESDITTEKSTLE